MTAVTFPRVQEVEPDSPAALAGLRAQTDYIIGTDTLMNEVQACSDQRRDFSPMKSQRRVDSACALPPER